MQFLATSSHIMEDQFTVVKFLYTIIVHKYIDYNLCDFVLYEIFGEGYERDLSQISYWSNLTGEISLPYWKPYLNNLMFCSCGK